MSRCECCNALLSVSEEKTKFKVSRTETNTCKKCLSTMDVEVLEVNDEYSEEDIISLEQLIEEEEAGHFSWSVDEFSDDVEGY